MKKFHALAVALSTAVLAACASGPVDPNAEVSFPELSSTHLKTGAFIEPEVFARIHPGLDRDQVRLILGNPHFNEGLIPKDTWNYVFNLRTGQGSEYISCQYQVQYAKVEPQARPNPVNFSEQVATRQSLMVAEHWASPTCEALVRSSVSEEQGQQAQTELDVLELEADALFAFGRSGLDSITAAGRRSLAEMMQQINQNYVDVEGIHVVGHTDRIGSAASNQVLSQKRAETVASYLATNGIARDLITTEGRGLTEPVVQCNEQQSRAELIQCLQPNRRVTLEITAVRASQ